MNKIVELIPEFFYDLIARITPGAILFFALEWHSFVNPNTMEKLNGAILILTEKVNGTILVLIALIALYVVGFFLDQISGMLFDCLNFCLRPIIIFISRKLLSRDSSVWEVEPWKILRSTSDDAQTVVLLKMTAERAMIRSIIVIWIVLWIFEISPIGNWAKNNLWGLFVLIAVLYRKDYYLHERAWTIKKEAKYEY